MTDIAEDARLRRHFPALVEAIGVVGSIQIRNRATLAGNICNASPAADTVPPLLVYGARVNLVGSSGRRRAELTEFFTGPGKTVMARGEMVESIDLPVPLGPAGASFGRITRRRGVDLATINLCCLVSHSGETRFAYGAVGPKPFLVTDTTGVLASPGSDRRQKEEILEDMIAHASPISNVRGSKEYRMAMLRVSSRRSLEEALEHLRHVGNKSMTGEPKTSGTIPVVMKVNGQSHALSVHPHHTLLDVLRMDLDLTGSKECCSLGECGACTVLLNGRAICSCLMLAVEADGCEITTIEGLAQHDKLDAVQTAFLEKGAVQCGFCIPGMIMSAKYLLMTNPHPTRTEIKEGLAGNLCRCAGYSRIVEAVAEAARSEQ